MRTLAVLGVLGLALAAGASAHRAHWAKTHDGYWLPDPTLTPGVTRPITRPEVCRTAWGRDVRHVTPAMKRRVCVAYGAPACPGPRWELDHLIPRELGGADEERNLFPQPIAQARLKDRAENWLHREVCAGRMGLEAAQRAIAGNWVTVFRATAHTPRDR